jgi:hypothetical protein
MKGIRLYCATALVSLLAFCSTPSVLGLGTLKEISTPYVGYYQCKTLRIGSKDFADTLNARLEVRSDGTLTLIWRSLFGTEQTMQFAYEYDEKAQAFFLTVPDGKGKKRVCMPYEKGSITLSENLSGKAFFIEFTQGKK